MSLQGGAHPAREPHGSGADADQPRHAEPLYGAHDTYEKGEVASIGALVADVSADISTLMRQEVALAKAEAKQSAVQAGRGAGLLGGAATGAWFTLLFLSVALWWALGAVMNRGWAAVVVAVIWAIIAAVLGVMGRAQLQKVKGLPHTVETAKQVPDALKGNEEQA